MDGCELLIRARERLDLNQIGFARLLARDASFISRIEAGKQQPSAELEALCLMIIQLIDGGSSSAGEIIARMDRLQEEKKKKVFFLKLSLIDLLTEQDRWALIN